MQDKKPKLRAFFSMMDSRKTMHHDIYQQLCVKRKTLILPIAIPYSSITEKMATKKQPLELFAASSAPALAYAELWQSIKRIRL
jgi:thiaminase